MIRTAFAVPLRAVEISHGKVYGSTYSRHIPKQNPMVQPIHKVTIFQFWSEPTSERNSWGQLPGLLLRHVLTEAKDLHASFRCLGRQWSKWEGFFRFNSWCLQFCLCSPKRMLLLGYITKQQVSGQNWSPFSRSESQHPHFDRQMVVVDVGSLLL